MSAAGPAETPVSQLGWAAIIVCSLVVLIIGVLVLIALFHRRGNQDEIYTDQVQRSGPGLTWVYTGVAISTVVLVALFVVSIATMGAVLRPRHKPVLTITVTAHQWWWELRYDDGHAQDMFTTANELHIPVHEPVRIELVSADVIHSFWVPRLAGKTDVIPGQTNKMWLEADSAGDFDGQCAEYCGLQHAQMRVHVIAESNADFRAWWTRQLAEAGAPSDQGALQGRQVFQERCGACHTVRGTSAGGIVGPDLTHLMDRTTIAAGLLPNTRGSLAGWIADAQGIKPGARMPAIELSSDQLQSVLSYLETLQ